jgi:hypothetical protein
VKKFICLKWADKGLGDLLEQGVELVLHPVKELKKKTHSKTRYGSGYEAEEEEQEEADDSVDPNFVPQDKKGMLARMEDKLKKIFCFQSFAHKKMYKAHYNEKMVRQRKIVMMHHIGMEQRVAPRSASLLRRSGSPRNVSGIMLILSLWWILPLWVPHVL